MDRVGVGCCGAEAVSRPSQPIWQDPKDLRCESCGAPAEVVLDDGGLWCINCDVAAREAGYDNDPAHRLGPLP